MRDKRVLLSWKKTEASSEVRLTTMRVAEAYQQSKVQNLPLEEGDVMVSPEVEDNKASQQISGRKHNQWHFTDRQLRGKEMSKCSIVNHRTLKRRRNGPNLTVDNHKLNTTWMRVMISRYSRDQGTAAETLP